MSAQVVEDLDKIGRFESSMKFVFATICSILLFVFGIYSIYKRNYKVGLIFIGIALFIFLVSYYSNKLVQSSSTYAAISGTGDIVRIVA